jgi:dUTP pyrophosphatase
MIKYSKLREVKSPSRGTAQSAGVDFFVPNDWNGGEPRAVLPGDRVLIPSGLKVSIPTGHALIAFNKSGVASKTGLIVGACVVDEDYQGEVHISMINTNEEKEYFADGHYVKDSGIVTITPGEKLVQFLLVPINYAGLQELPIEELYTTETSRGEGGFGSTGTL